MIKYRIDYRNHFNELCRVDISNDSYSGDIILVRGTEGQACTIDSDVNEDPYEPICNSKAAISVENQGQIDTEELKQANDKDFTVNFYVEGVIKWRGFVISDGIQSAFQSLPYTFIINATDGLMLLDSIDYNHDNLTGGRCILNYFRQILFASSNLGLPLPIRWVNTLKNDAFTDEDDIFSGSVEWSPKGEGFTDYNGNIKTCMYILEGMLRSMQSRISQSDGFWKIERINDIVTGVYSYRETPAVLTGFDISDPVEVDVNKTISSTSQVSDYSFIEEDAFLRTLKALKTVKTTYKQDQRDNILPNGNMDILSLSIPIYWSLITPGSWLLSSAPSLSGAAGTSAKVQNLIGSSSCIFILDSLPIDTDVLYSSLTFGFKFMIETWWNVDGDGYIIWGDTAPFNAQVIYRDGTDTWYLNEFGYWTQTDIKINIEVPSLKLNDAAQLDFGNKQTIKIPIPNPVPVPRTSRPSIQVLFNLQPELTIYFDDVYLKVDDNSDVYEGTTTSNYTGKEEYELNISSSHNGFYVSNYMTSYSQSGLEKFFSDSISSGMTLTEMTTCAILRNRNKPSQLFDGSVYGSGWKYGEIYEIETLTDKKFLPLRASWNTETCTTNMTMVEVRDDDVSISVKHYGSNDNDKNLSN